MDVHAFLAGVVVELPAPRAVIPLAFVEDATLPDLFAPVEPVAFIRACTLVLWGPIGLRN